MLKSLLIFILLASFYSNACTLTMGYRLNARPPLINAHPDNSGLYKEIFTLAAKRINCQLSIVREPKKRIIQKLKQGKIDFYPGFTFSKERNDYVAFFENGLESSFLAISTLNQPEITKISQLNAKVLLVAHGGPTLEAEKYGAYIRYVEDLTIEQAIRYLLQDKADFYIYPKASIDYYLKSNPEKLIKRHQCCGVQTPMLLGFSRKSPHLFNQVDKKLNTPVLTNIESQHNKNSTAYALVTTLQKMKKQGEITHLYQKYYH